MRRSPVDFPNASPDATLRPAIRKTVYVLRRHRKTSSKSLRYAFPRTNSDLIQGITRSNPSSADWVNLVADNHSISDSHRHRIAAVLKFLMERASQRPRLSSHEDELFVEWRFGRQALELSIPDTDQEIYVRITDLQGHEIKVAFLNQISEEERNAAAEVSELLKASAGKGS